MDLANLNEYQSKAVYDESDTCIVNANVGSGKTTVLISKVQYLVMQKNIPLDQIVVLTFTNKAAKEIKERLFQIDSTLSQSDIPYFGTFHSVALSMLKNLLPIDTLGYTTDFTVITPEEEIQIAEQLIIEQGYQIKYKNRLKKRLEQGFSVKDPSKRISKYSDDLFTLIDALTQEKVKQNKMSFSDLLTHTVQLLQNNPTIFSPKWIIVDEVQDCDDIQLSFIDCLKKSDCKLFVVGDPNQVIYSWRGSAFNIFYQLRTKYDATEYSLPLNYRSTDFILDAAKRFSQNASVLEGVRKSGHKIMIQSYYDSFQESAALAERISKLHADGIPYGEIAILYRLQSQTKQLEAMFERENIPYHIAAKKTIQDIPVLNWLYHLLRFVFITKDITSGVYILCDKTYGEGISPKKALKEIRNGYTYLPSLLLSTLQFENITANELYDFFLLDLHIKPNTASYTEDKKYVLDFFSDLLHFLQIDKKATVQNYLDEICLNGQSSSFLADTYQTSIDRVQFMTLHASKGLEFSHVFIIGVNNGLIPMKANSFEEEDEERRLFYVGMTRAKNYLELSYYTSADSYQVFPGPSIFLRMIPAQCCAEQSSVVQRSKGDQAKHLQQMKRQILENRSNINTTVEPVTEKCDTTVISQVDTPQPEQILRIRHAKYGEGVILKEDDQNITILFDDYGEKDFVKMFTQLEYL